MTDQSSVLDHPRLLLDERRICHLSELRLGRRDRGDLGGFIVGLSCRLILVCALQDILGWCDGTFRALADLCLHQGLDEGHVRIEGPSSTYDQLTNNSSLFFPSSIILAAVSLPFANINAFNSMM